MSIGSVAREIRSTSRRDAILAHDDVVGRQRRDRLALLVKRADEERALAIAACASVREEAPAIMASAAAVASANASRRDNVMRMETWLSIGAAFEQGQA